jgi:hypothetical protein
MTLALVWVGIYIVQGGTWQGLCYSTQQVGVEVAVWPFECLVHVLCHPLDFRGGTKLVVI